MGTTCSSVFTGILEGDAVRDLAASDANLDRARYYSAKKNFSKCIQHYNEALRLRVKFFGLDENTEASLRQRKMKVLERRMCAVKTAVVMLKLGNKAKRACHPGEEPPADTEAAAGTAATDSPHTARERPKSASHSVTEQREYLAALGNGDLGHSSRKYKPQEVGAGPRTAMNWITNKGAFEKHDTGKTVETKLVGGRVMADDADDLEESLCEADLAGIVPYHYSHVQLLVEIGNLHLTCGKLHYAFFFFVQTISIVGRIVKAMKPAEDLGSALMLYVDGVLGLCIIYVKCSLSDALSKLYAKDIDEHQAMMEMFQLPNDSHFGGDASILSANLNNSSVFAAKQVQIAAASGGLNATFLVRNSIAKMIDALEGSNPLDIAEKQAQTAIRRVRDVDGPRSNFLIPLMHVKAQVQLMLGMKRAALLTVQKTLGMTYCRHGARDAMDMCLYSHRILLFIKAEIAEESKQDAAKKTGDALERGVSLVAEHILASEAVSTSVARATHEDAALSMLQDHLSADSMRGFGEIRRVSSIHYDRTVSSLSEANSSGIFCPKDANAAAAEHDADHEDNTDLWFTGCRRMQPKVGSPIAGAHSPHSLGSSLQPSGDFTSDDCMIRRIVHYLRSLGHAALAFKDAPRPVLTEAAGGMADDTVDRRPSSNSPTTEQEKRWSFQSTSSDQAALAGVPPAPVPMHLPLPVPEDFVPGTVDDTPGALGDDDDSPQRRPPQVPSMPPHLTSTPPHKPSMVMSESDVSISVLAGSPSGSTPAVAMAISPVQVIPRRDDRVFAAGRVGSSNSPNASLNAGGRGNRSPAPLSRRAEGSEGDGSATVSPNGTLPTVAFDPQCDDNIAAAVRGGSSSSLSTSNAVTGSGCFPPTRDESPAATALHVGLSSARKFQSEDDVSANGLPLLE